MQQPRRTSEFYEEPVKVHEEFPKKRQSRLPTRNLLPVGVSPMTSCRTLLNVAHKPSMDHAFGSVRKDIGTRSMSASASKLEFRGVTPQRSPTHKPPNRALFSTEKQRIGSSLALHNNKKWVQEHSSHLMDYLGRVNIPGIPAEFFGRTTSLRELSIKHLVAIINHFVRFIWGNRYKVGTNYIEDIMNILQKLEYPYQINKSCLKTPTATHSIGNIVVLLNFMLDFVPDNSTLPLQDVEEFNVNIADDESRQTSTEFNAQLLQHVQESFELWDKQRMQEFKSIQQKTCDALVSTHGLKNMDELNKDVAQLEQELMDLEKQQPIIKQEDADLCQQFENEFLFTKQKLEMLMDDIVAEEEQLGILQTKEEILLAEAACLEAENASYKLSLDKQIGNVRDRDLLITEVDQLKHMRQCIEKTVIEWQELNYGQQVKLARMKKQLTTEIEKFNAHISEIEMETCSLQLPFNINRQEFNQIELKLNELRKQLDVHIRAADDMRLLLEEQTSEIMQEIETVLQPKNFMLETAKADINKDIQTVRELCLAQDKQLQVLDIEMQCRKRQIVQCKERLSVERKNLESQELQNERLVADAEKETDLMLLKRKAVLAQSETELEIATKELSQLSNVVSSVEARLKELEEEH